MPLRTRILTPPDQPALEAFLDLHPNSTLFLRSNLIHAGLAPDQGARYQGTWVGAFDGDELAGVACLCWNGNLILEAPHGLPQVTLAARAHSPRELVGILGRWTQVEGARDALGLRHITPHLNSQERLYALDLQELCVPTPLTDGTLRTRPPHDHELPLITDWRIDYSAEALHTLVTPSVRQHLARAMREKHAEGDHWVLVHTHDDIPLAYSAFNARTPDCVQVGGVWTPRGLRRRGYGRAVVAGTLLHARDAEGVSSSVLFTDLENIPAQRAYEALGYTACGDYGIVLFAPAG